MKPPKEGDKIRLIGTFVNATVIINHCNGLYDIQFTDGFVKKYVKLAELQEPTGKAVKEWLKVALFLYCKLADWRNGKEKKVINFIAKKL